MHPIHNNDYVLNKNYDNDDENKINKLNAHIQEIKMPDTTIAVGKPSCYCTNVHSIMFRKSTHKVTKMGKFYSAVRVNTFFSLCKSTFSIP